ncbi:hypothetical protein Pla22_25290 [Rubripirellula amarantea]|uniref:Uncharacterized protein n=1 Tax=Rubripirellula amarantea TaxID=2527999 RepID=A0A5C5WY95_9BACT|nr:hypothetical protein Pla22_25290 [Rubripirellula amarantea]
MRQAVTRLLAVFHYVQVSRFFHWRYFLVGIGAMITAFVDDRNLLMLGYQF